MNSRIWLAIVFAQGSTLIASAADTAKPNVVFILADDLGYGDVGCFGQTKIRTPNLDRLAKDGLKFTQCYAGSTVCAPSRCALMTGLHTGHCRIRGNGGTPQGNHPLRPDDLTVAEVFKRNGYATALVGKWGLGEENSVGIPTKKGFDFFYGYLNQVHAHNYYPPFLLRNQSRELFPENVQNSKFKGVAQTTATYAPDKLLTEATGYINANKSRPFFLYFATIAPHANNERTKVEPNGSEVPNLGPYADEPWPLAEKSKAAVITRLDADIGTILKTLDNAGLRDNTLVIFSSDNGPHREGGNDPAYFQSSGPLRGIKRSVTDGGIRAPTIARWPGIVSPGRETDLVCAHWDFLPTVQELLGEKAQPALDGISLLPTLTERGTQVQHAYLYWEFHERASKRAIRFGPWKAIREPWNAPVQLFDVVNDLGEAKNVAADHPKLVAKANEIFESARTDSPEFPILTPKKP